ncbi:hypothetical protein [Streptomyces mangrovisoli]|uniref:MarR family transcriptional regulator n=1 Tax=Streptomyces mangrovisoli TaxID=1428628 RepID=A0A1J4NZ66_9ACTN|nr:hypothetical protein [Streptomyces mangrovisoli]OIJ66470.1 MarR family transcriptional regulator [Streptomyces mangrovisoli]
MTTHTSPVAPIAPVTDAPAADSRMLGLAHYAARAVQEKVLAGRGVTFEQLLTLRPVAQADVPVAADDVVARTAGALKTGEAAIRTVVAELVGQGLLAADGPLLRPTDAGRTLYAEVSAETAVIAARIYADIPAEDLLAAGRVLATITARAEAELAALSA